MRQGLSHPSKFAFLIIGHCLIGLLGSGWARSAPTTEPIAYVGHGAMFASDGKEIDATPAFVEQALQYYLDDLATRATSEQRASLIAIKSKLFDGKDWNQLDRLHANTELLDWLLKQIRPRNGFELQGKINLIRTRLRNGTLSGQNQRSLRPSKVLEALIAQIPPAGKIDRNVIGFSTMLSGQAYIDECAASGVPIPPAWNSNESTGWELIGALSDTEEFISSGSEARVYKFDSSAPLGTCLALPRVGGNGSASDAGLLGIICLGKTTSKVCFWDNQVNDVGVPVPLGVTKPLIEFAGGAELLGGNGGVCTTCHAGENPFVTHPGTALDFGGIFGNDWYDPLVHPDWPQNAGPTNVLAAVPSAGQCTSCHVQGGTGGRFPKLSTTLSGYCGTILSQAIGNTMPSGPAYQAHIDALQNLCTQTPSPAMRVDSVIDFREVELGFAFKKALIIHNDGDAALTVSVAILTPAGDPNLAQWSDLNAITPVVIQPGEAPIILPQVYEPQALGTHTVQLRISSDDPSAPTKDVTLTGIGISPVPVDTVLVLDRSGSMQDAAGDRRKIDAMRDAAMLYVDLLRENIGGTGTGDKIAFVKYNAANSVYMGLDFISDAKKNAISLDQLSDSALTLAAKLKPEGTTGIGGGMLTAAGEIGTSLPDRKQVMVVLTDGKENETPYIADVVDDVRAGNANLQLYSLGLGFDIEPTKLQSITNMGSGGYHQVAAELSGENLFDLETFYFKIFSNATGMELVVDPTHVVNLLNPDPVVVDNATIISSDRSANFLVLDNPALRAFYDLEFVSPTGTVMVAGASVGGIPIQEMNRHTYRVFRVVFPDLSQESTYVGDWLLRLKPNGKWSERAVKAAMAESNIQPSDYINPYQGMVPVGFAAAVDSNYKLAVELLPSGYLPGAEVRVTGALSDRGWPAVDGKIDVKITSPNNTVYNLKLHDDGSHGDAEANDGVWTNRFDQTGVAGVYKFLFHSVGHNERGELAPREATRFLTLQQPESTPGGDSPSCLPCQWLRLWMLVVLALLVLLLYCCYRHRKG